MQNVIMENYYKYLTPASTLTFVLSRKLLKVPIRHRNFRANFAAAMRRQSRKCRLSECYVDARIGALLEVENEENFFNSNIWNYFIFFICCSIWLKNGNDFR